MDTATFESQAWEFFLEQARATTFVGVAAFILFCLFIALIWRAQRSKDNAIDISDWFRDPSTGHTTRRALGELAFLFISAVAVFYVLTASHEEYPSELKIYFVSFMTVLWVARSLLGPVVQAIAAKFGGGGSPNDEADGTPAPEPKPAMRAAKRAAAVKATNAHRPAPRAVPAE